MPDQLSGRVLAVFFWFTLIIVSNIYKGNLIASLATFTPKLPFLTLEEVAADEQYTILMVNDSSQRTLLEVQFYFKLLLVMSKLLAQFKFDRSRYWHIRNCSDPFL